VLAILFALPVSLLITAWYYTDRIEPFVRAQTRNYLAMRFNADVELGHLDVFMPMRDPVRLLLQKGKGAHIRVRADNISLRYRGRRDVPPLFAIQGLEFRLELATLWQTPIHIDYVKVAKFEVTIPPKGQNPRIRPGAAAKVPATTGTNGAESAHVPGSGRSLQPQVIIDQMDLDGMKLVILPGNPAREALEFEMKTLRLESAGIGVPMRYRTTMTNARPPGLIDSTGSFGPFLADEPGETPVAGDYVFKDADLGVFQPISGRLDSSGHFQGKLNRIVVDGDAHVPDFRLKSAGNVVPLRTTFHAIVDGTDGDTLLQPVLATLGGSQLVCSGGVVRNRDEQKKTIDFEVTVQQGRIADFLRLAVKGAKAPLEGRSVMNFRMMIPPGAGKLTDRLVLDGTFALKEASFTSNTVQEKIDDISRRTQGMPSATEIQGVTSDFEGSFTLKGGVLELSRLIFAVPGADVILSGWYDINSEMLDFRGSVRTRARISQMMKTRWKRIVLRPVDPFFAKDGAGAVIPIAITGTRGDPKFGLDHKKKRGKGGQSPMSPIF
jgi:hypothetical protein